ncbi:MAG TPA: hypothetical protein VJ860_03185 [Polyangia bacterium]|jgi:hypothetical protein|nr:hypothetical protein [Polyangia bacterium]
MTSGRPWFVLVAGINGAGESTFAQNRETLGILLEARGPDGSLANLPWFWHHASRALVSFNGSSVPEPVLMAERWGSKVWFALDAPAPWAPEPLLPKWGPRSRKP